MVDVRPKAPVVGLRSANANPPASINADLSSSQSRVSSLAVEVDRISEPEWNALLARFADSSIYQTWAYGAVCWGERQLSHLLLKCGTEVVAAAQLRILRIPLLKCGIAYLRWGPLWRLFGEPRRPEIFDHMLCALHEEYVERRGLLLRVLPAVFQDDGYVGEIESSLRGRKLSLDSRIKPYRTLRVNVTRSLDSARKGLQSRWRNYLKVAETVGFAVKQGTGVDLYSEFSVLYREMMARKQFETTVNIEEFHLIQKRLPDCLKMQVFICSLNGQAQNALVVSALGDSAIYLLAATGNAGLNGRGAYLLQWRAIEWLHRNGLRWYDTGGINKERNPGGYQFKSGLGGQEVLHLGRFELREKWLSATVATIGDQTQLLVSRMKGLVRQSVRAVF